MKKTNDPQTVPDPGATLPVSAAEAARMLSAQLGGSETTWVQRLINWRRPERKSPIPWQEGPMVRPFYIRGDVQAYIDATLAKRTATTPPEPGPLTATATAVPDFEGGHAYVKILWHAGTAQGAFSLPAKTAAQLAKKLIHALAQVKNEAEARIAARAEGSAA